MDTRRKQVSARHYVNIVCIRLVLLAFAKRLAGDQANAPALFASGTVKHLVHVVRRVPDRFRLADERRWERPSCGPCQILGYSAWQGSHGQGSSANPGMEQTTV